MTSLTYDGGVIQISDTQMKFIHDVIDKQGFKDSKVTLETVGNKGDNYLANIVRIIAERKDGETFKMIAKVAPVIEMFRKITNIEIIFNNETVMYMEVLPKFLELQKNAGVAENELINFAICYGILSEAPNEIILLEDLKESNYEMLSRFESMPDECMRLALKELVIIHSMSFVLKNKEPNTYEVFKHKLADVWEQMNSTDEMRIYMEKLTTDFLSIMNNEKYKKIVEEVMSQLQISSEKLRVYDSKSKYSIIQQGDCWNNNIMFKFENGKPLKAIMIDYQLSKEANPAYDFLYLTFNCTDYETRQKYFTDWVDYYHMQLDESLSKFGLKTNFLYPRDQFDTDLKRHGILSMATSFMLSNMTTRESHETIDMKTNTDDILNNVEEAAKAFSVSNLNEKSISKIRNRIEGVIDSYIEFGFY